MCGCSVGHLLGTFGSKPCISSALGWTEQHAGVVWVKATRPPWKLLTRRGSSFVLDSWQVASRVQKYFIKLTKAGIPVPGRTPNLCMYTKKVTVATSTRSTQNNTLKVLSVEGTVPGLDDDRAHHNRLCPGLTKNLSGCQCNLAQ